MSHDKYVRQEQCDGGMPTDPQIWEEAMKKSAIGNPTRRGMSCGASAPPAWAQRWAHPSRRASPRPRRRSSSLLDLRQSAAAAVAAQARQALHGEEPERHRRLPVVPVRRSRQEDQRRLRHRHGAGRLRQPGLVHADLVRQGPAGAARRAAPGLPLASTPSPTTSPPPS